MSSVSDGGVDSARRRRRSTAAVKESLRELRNQLSLLNHQVSTQLALKDVDLDCLELIALHAPISPSALARRAGLHPATMTGILDRLQRGGWIVRERAPEAADRRAITVRPLRDRNAEMFRLYSGMNAAMDKLCAEYSQAELELIADFLRRTTSAGHDATEDLSAGTT
ncbi:MarR family transcriptional regulator [Actinosynnema sp. ALI-1.44]|uniref:MarR family winged helix-turn-helix transcriptional regulator n=1 Tax=Actinosynnema sp. ALI-1.44 TaxID=1933779 RepID=UPI00097BC1D2|nr:MarR family transcriptional regulator [Actinosynnema sp. ALI-1.44]ONI85390.1 MarR family transcriptional regulator [Actinosynnema sp. ALI-1.44]